MIEFVMFYFLISFNNLKEKKLKLFLTKQQKNEIVNIIILMAIIYYINNILLYIIFILVLKTRNIFSKVIKILLLQTYYYYFLKTTLLRNNDLKFWLSLINCKLDLFFFKKNKSSLQILKFLIFGLILIVCPIYLSFTLYLVLELKNYYYYTLDYIYDSFSLCYYFGEEIFLTESGRAKIDKYRKNLILGIKNENFKLEYYIDFNHIED